MQHHYFFPIIHLEIARKGIYSHYLQMVNNICLTEHTESQAIREVRSNSSHHSHVPRIICRLEKALEELHFYKPLKRH